MEMNVDDKLRILMFTSKCDPCQPLPRRPRPLHMVKLHTQRHVVISWVPFPLKNICHVIVIIIRGDDITAVDLASTFRNSISFCIFICLCMIIFDKIMCSPFAFVYFCLIIFDKIKLNKQKEEGNSNKQKQIVYC